MKSLREKRFRKGYTGNAQTAETGKKVINIGRSQQKKGRDGELELVRILNSLGFRVSPGRILSFGSEPDIIGLEGIHIEVKRVERLNVPEAMKQAIRDSERFNDGIPCLFHRRNREQWLVTMRMEDFLTMYRTGKGE